MVAVATPSDNLLASLELADIWSAVVLKGDHKHISLAECCPLDSTDIKQGSHTFVSSLCSFKKKKNKENKFRVSKISTKASTVICPCVLCERSVNSKLD